MSLPISATWEPHGSFGRFLEKVTEVFAIVGGFMLVLVMLVESASVIGRGLSGFLPVSGISGDSELVQIGCASAIFSFLPYCQIRRGNVFVDFFTKHLPVRVKSTMDLLANLLFLALVMAIVWQLMHGTIEKFEYQDTTTIMRIPEGWAYLLCLLSGVLLVITTAFTVFRSMNEIRKNRLIGPQPSGEH